MIQVFKPWIGDRTEKIECRDPNEFNRFIEIARVQIPDPVNGLRASSFHLRLWQFFVAAWNAVKNCGLKR